MYLIQMRHPKAHLQGVNEYLPMEVLVRLELFYPGGFMPPGKGPLVASFMLALAPDIITSGKESGQA